MEQKIRRTGLLISLYGVVIVLLWIGLFKFTPTEAKAIQPLVSNSPLMSWWYKIAGVQGVSNFIGGFEILTGLLLGAFPWSKRLSLVGGVLNTFIFLTTLSFLFSTPGTWHQVDGFWLTDAFILKDIMALGIGILIAGESYMHLRKA